MTERPWYSLVDGKDPAPPTNTWVETKGGWGDDRIVKDYINSSIGDWMHQPGDPTHWRPLEQKQEVQVAHHLGYPIGERGRSIGHCCGNGCIDCAFWSRDESQRIKT